MNVAVIRESFPGETRVALIPSGVSTITKAGGQVGVEAGAGDASLHPDQEYESRGAHIEAERARLLSEADVVLMVRGPGAHREFPAGDLDALTVGTAIIGLLEPLAQPAAAKGLADRNLNAFAMELIPRITRAQSMDALSSMANIAGYQAVLRAANASPKMFPMMMTAAGTVTPAKVFVLGAGVAGLQAIATAKRLGAVVDAYDVRPVVKEQVESLGARFVELGLETKSAEVVGGYAAAQSEDFYRRQQELLTEHLAAADVIIATALVPGKKAPVLISEEMAARLTPGTVVVDLAAEKGGNCAMTQPGQRVERDGVIVLGPINLPAETPYHASQMYSKNISTFLLYLIHEGALQVDREDEIVQATLVAHEGRVVHPAVQKALEEEGG